MSINENINGKNEFDPTKKVRAILGDDFVDEVEADALAKLSAASKAAVVSNNVYEEVYYFLFFIKFMWSGYCQGDKSVLCV